jgi:hypothetical protein
VWGAVQALDSSMGGGGPLPDLMSAGTPSSRRDVHEADCTPETATRGQGGQMPPQPRRAEPLEGAHVMGPLFDAASTASQQSPASQQDGAEGADDALCALIKLIWPDAPVLFCKALYDLMTKGSSVKYCGTVAKKGADSQQRWLGLKSAVMCNSQLLASAAGGGTDSRAALPQKFVDTKSPEFRGLLTAFVSLGLEFQENHAAARQMRTICCSSSGHAKRQESMGLRTCTSPWNRAMCCQPPRLSFRSSSVCISSG